MSDGPYMGKLRSQDPPWQQMQLVTKIAFQHIDVVAAVSLVILIGMKICMQDFSNLRDLCQHILNGSPCTRQSAWRFSLPSTPDMCQGHYTRCAWLVFSSRVELIWVLERYGWSCQDEGGFQGTSKSKFKLERWSRKHQLTRGKNPSKTSKPSNNHYIIILRVVTVMTENW